MGLTLYLDRYRWFQHFAKLDQAYPGYLPVIKGNGYGFGNLYLAQTALEYGKSGIAAGTIEEARQISEIINFNTLIILTPVLTDLTTDDLSRYVFTVGSEAQLSHLIKAAQAINFRLPVRVLLKCQSSMKRYGFAPEDFGKVKELLAETPNLVHIEGFALHFPLARTNDQSKLEQVASWLQQINSYGLQCNQLYVSHLSKSLFKEMQRSNPHISLVMRLGTELWLGNKDAYSFRTTVLDIKPVMAGQRYGYKQKRSWRDSYLVYVSGGSANGVGLEAPSHASGFKDRLKLTVFWLLSLFNLHLSPFTYCGQRLWFAEPPHMQASVLKISKKLAPPKPGEEIALKNLRMTIANFDSIVEVQPETEVS